MEKEEALSLLYPGNVAPRSMEAKEFIQLLAAFTRIDERSDPPIALALCKHDIPHTRRQRAKAKMEDKALFNILTYQRQPGLWRAAISRKDKSMISLDGAKAEGNVATPVD